MNIRVGSPKKGVLLTQAAFGVTYTSDHGDVSILALGNTALDMYGRLPKVLKHRQLIKDGSIQDFGCMAELLRQLFLQMQERTVWGNQQVTLCVSEAANDAEKQQVSQLLRQAGVRKLNFVSRMIAIGVALGLPINDPQAHCIVDVGAHTTEIAILSCGAVVRSKQLKIGGDAFSLSLLRQLRKNYGIEISIRQADRIKEQYGSANVDSGDAVVEILGRSVQHAFPTIKHVSLGDVQKGLRVGIEMWSSAIEAFFDELPIELSADIAQNGVFLVGGGALLEDLDWVLSDRLGLLVIAPDDRAELCLTGAALMS